MAPIAKCMAEERRRSDGPSAQRLCGIEGGVDVVLVAAIGIGRAEQVTVELIGARDAKAGASAVAGTRGLDRNSEEQKAGGDDEALYHRAAPTARSSPSWVSVM